MDKTILTRQQALAIGFSRYFTGRPCKNGHIAERYTAGRSCIVCTKEGNQRKSKEHRSEYWKKYYTEEVRKRCSARAKERGELNPFKKRKFRAERKLRVAQATIRCEKDKIAVAELYIKARRLTLETGVEYCVDHIIPLAHSDVCGLHTAANLQVIPASKNRRKGTYFDPTEHEFIAEKS